MLNQTAQQMLTIMLFCCLSAAAFAQTPQRRSSASPNLPARQTDEQATILLKPLAKDDPRAQLAPELLNAPAMPTPVYGPDNQALGAAASQVWEYDSQTGAETQSAAENFPLPEFVRAQLADGQAQLPGHLGVSLQQDATDLRPQKTPGDSIVIGADDRVRITDTATYPGSAITKLYLTFPNGKTYDCSGTLIQARYVLTAGHCVYSREDGGWATTTRVIPGMNGSYMPYGEARGRFLRSVGGWTVSNSRDWDFALVTLENPVGYSTGWLGLTSYANPNGVQARILGYPGDRDRGLNMYFHYGPVTGSTDQQVFYQIDTFGGQSGSGVYTIEPNGYRYVFAVHVAGDGSRNLNIGCRLTYEKYSIIVSWLNSGY